MHDARDAEDGRLLEAGEHQRLVESYYGVVLDRCRAKLPTEGDGIDVAADVVIRVLSELKRGRTYSVPFRVVVHQVTTWKIKEFFAQASSEVALDELLEALGDESGFEAVESDLALDDLFRELPPRDREVATMRWRKGMEIVDIAAALGLTANAVYQSIHRTIASLREKWT
jgi:RNA polymerase sigma factor (sigma-70 family)